jgi:hypothetical protein
MEMAELLDAFDRAASNLGKLEATWDRAKSFMPSGPSRGSDSEYDHLCRVWDDLLAELPPIDDWTVTDALPDIDAVGQAFLDYAEIGEPSFALHEVTEKPGKDIDEYRFRLNRARRRAIRERLEQLTTLIDIGLSGIVQGVERESSEKINNESTDSIVAAVREIERLIGDIAQRQGRWSDMHRHMYFSEGHDWHDIIEFDWPGVREDIQAASFADTDPIPVPRIDLGKAAGGQLTGTVTLALQWGRLDDDGFERLLYDLLRAFPEFYKNVQWLMKTRAPDRGRDLSVDRHLRTGLGSVRVERVIVQAKHWLSKSVGPAEVTGTLASIKLWEPPIVRSLIMATSGRFTTDAVQWVEKHNNEGQPPLIELWPDSQLETLLAQKPEIAIAYKLR